MKKIGILIILLFAILTSNAQRHINFSYTLDLGEGYVLPTNTFVRGENVDNTKINNMGHIAFKVVNDVDGSKSWQNLYNDFRFGLGAFYGRFNYSKHLNNPFAFYGFAGFSPIKYKNFTFKNELALGIVGVFDCYGSDNQYNVAVSLPIETYFHLDFQGFWKLNNYFDFSTSLAFIHFSNGAVLKPNKGINTLSLELGLTYHPQRITKDNILPQPIDSTEKSKQNWYINTFAGIHAVGFDYMKTDSYKKSVQKSYIVYGLQGRYLRNLTEKYSIGAGLECLQNTAVGKTDSVYLVHPEKRDYDYIDKMSAGMFLSFQYNISNLSVYLEPGHAFWQVHGYASREYQRLGLKYNLTDYIVVQMALRAYNFHVADWIEWGIGIRL